MMIAAHIRIAPLVSTIAVEPQVIRDLIYASAMPRERLEHVFIRAGPRGVDIFAFIDAEDPTQAARSLHKLVGRTIAASALLRSWRIV